MSLDAKYHTDPSIGKDFEGWVKFKDELPPEGLVVNTKIVDAHSERMEQELVRQGNLMYFPDKSMYVYYAPTHWYKTKAV